MEKKKYYKKPVALMLEERNIFPVVLSAVTAGAKAGLVVGTAIAANKAIFGDQKIQMLPKLEITS